MMKLSEEQKVQEITKFIGLMKHVGLDLKYDMDKLQIEVSESPCAINENVGTAYKGALLIHINMICAIAQRIAKMVSGTFQIDDVSLLRVCLIMHLSKRDMYIENDNEWEIKNRGLLFKFNDNIEACLKGGERSALEALNLGVQLTPTELEAIKCLDDDDSSKKPFVSILTTIVRQANELAYAIEKEKYKNITNK